MPSLTALFGSCAHPAAPAAGAAAKTGSLTAPAPAPQALTMLPAELLRSALVASFVAPAIDRSIDAGVALVQRAAPLPLDAAAVRQMALAQAGLPPEIAENLDLTTALSGAAVGGGPGNPVLSAFTFAGKDAARTTALLASIGQVVARRPPAVQLQTRSGESAWFLQLGNVVVFSDTQEGLVRAGSLALEARTAGGGAGAAAPAAAASASASSMASPGSAGDDVTIVIYPDALARSQGTDVRTIADRYIQELDAGGGAGQPRLAPGGRSSLRQIAAYLADVGVAHAALQIHGERGLAVKLRLFPRAGSPLEQLAREIRVAPLDARLLGRPGAEVGLAATSAYRERTFAELKRLQAVVAASGPPPAPATRLLEALASGLSGEGSGVGRLLPSLSFEVVYPARDRAAAAAIRAALERVDQPAAAALWAPLAREWGLARATVKASTERIRGARALRWTVTPSVPASPSAAAAQRKLLGGDSLDVYGLVVGQDRVVIAAGKDAKLRLTAMAAGKAGVATGAVAEATAASSGRSLFYFVDLRQIVSYVAAALDQARAPAVALLAGGSGAPLPVFGGVRGDASGRLLTLDLTVPASCFTGLGSLLQGMR